MLTLLWILILLLGTLVLLIGTLVVLVGRFVVLVGWIVVLWSVKVIGVWGITLLVAVAVLVVLWRVLVHVNCSTTIEQLVACEDLISQKKRFQRFKEKPLERK